ncbi:disulfide bond formation protein B [Novosphingobium sp.]|uniref:disulfide bond formation protein B n=1 Tax=Novosphingobium sp. TaxID=1874826 RepID=UPI0025E7442B|nr:disulfide bond formation protein B [Novosphingobium sp.]MCC6927111.1 disulfide bond formation protein B [Novosphingobium sp.]
MLPTGPAAGRAALWLALGVPAALLGGAYIGEYVFGLWPCEMCWWQRYAHFAALGLALLALARPAMTVLVRLAGLAILIGGLIGAYHAGVEYGWWQGFTACTSEVAVGDDPLKAILDAPMVRCDQVQWDLFGISLAGYNFLISVPAALLVFVLAGRARGRAA